MNTLIFQVCFFPLPSWSYLPYSRLIFNLLWSTKNWSFFSPLCWYVYCLKTFSDLIRIDFFMVFYQICFLFAGLKFDGNKLFIKMQVSFYCTEKSSCLHKKYNKWNKTKITDVVIKSVNVCIIELHWNYCKWCCYIV